MKQKIIKLKKGTDIRFGILYYNRVCEKNIIEKFIDPKVSKFVDEETGRLNKPVIIRIIVEEGK